MPVPYTYDRKLKAVMCRPHDDVAIDEVVGFFNAVLEDDEVEAGSVEVVFLDGVDEFSFSTAEARVIPKKILELREARGLVASIFIAEGDLHFGMARMFTTLHEMADPAYPVEILRDRADVQEALTRLTA